MRRIVALIILLVFLITALTACYDATELDELTYVLAIGLDNGVKDKLRLSVEFHTMQGEGGGNSSGGGGGGASGGDYTTITVDAPSLFTGLNMINATLPRKLNFMHTKFLVFSEEMAREGIATYIAPIIRYREIRRSLHVIVSRGKASDFLKENQPFIGTTLSKSMELYLNEPEDIGYFPHVTLSDLYNGILSTYRQPVAILGGINDLEHLPEGTARPSSDPPVGGQYYAGEMPRKGGSKLELFGTAVFNGDKMVAELTGDETRVLMMLMGDFKRSFFTIQDPEMPQYVVPLDVRMQRERKVKADIRNGIPYIDVKLELEGDILAVQSRINYESIELKTVLEQAFVKELKAEMDQLIEKCRKINCDVFGFGRIACRKFLTIQDWEKYDWNKQFKNAQVSVDIHYTIRRTGTLMKSSPVKDSEGEEGEEE